MINHFREQMPRPIVGIGHSLGGAQLSFAPSNDDTTGTDLSPVHSYLFCIPVS